MAAILLPSSPWPDKLEPFFASNAADLVSPLGGETQRVSRPGDRFGLQVTLPAMAYEDAMAWLAALVQSASQMVRFPVRQDGLTIGAPGAPLVTGAAQAGMLLNADGFAAGYAARAGQFFSILTSSRRYLHMLTGNSTANGAGAATLAFEPMLRVPPTDNAVLEFAQPYLEGFIQGPRLGWTAERIGAVGLSFQILEAE